MAALAKLSVGSDHDAGGTVLGSDELDAVGFERDLNTHRSRSGDSGNAFPGFNRNN
jgi:hypothetical protein